MAIFRWSRAANCCLLYDPGAASGPFGAGCARASKARFFWMLQFSEGAIMKFVIKIEYSSRRGVRHSCVNAGHPCCALDKAAASGECRVS